MSDTLQLARDRAVELGIKVHHRANEATIRKAIESHLAKEVETDPGIKRNAPAFGKGKVMNRKEFLQEELSRRKRSVGALKRIRVTCMNPTKSDWDGEVLSVGSATMGTWKKFVPFNGKPYHVPQMIYDMLKERKCTIFTTVRERGQNFKKPELINEFAIHDLEPLTQAELKELAQRQALGDTGL